MTSYRIGLALGVIVVLVATLPALDRPISGWVPVAQAAEAVILAEGRFRDADARHKGSGEARLTRLADGGHVLRLENFKGTAGPDLRLVASSHPDPRTKSQVHEGFLDLGKLKGNDGDYDYPLPAGADAGAIKSVIVYCRAFGVIFAVAPLQ